MSKDSVGPESPDKPRKFLAFSGRRWKIGERVVAEQEGFEPSIRGYRIHTFQACAFDHSATAPHSRPDMPSKEGAPLAARR